MTWGEYPAMTEAQARKLWLLGLSAEIVTKQFRSEMRGRLKAIGERIATFRAGALTAYR
jgi:hypothetical protein